MNTLEEKLSSREKRKGRAKAGFPSAAGELEGEAVAKGDFVLLGFKVSERFTSQVLKVC